MELNALIELDGKRDSDQVIKRKIERLISFGYKTIGLTVRIEASKLSQVPEPPNVALILENIPEKNRIQLVTRLTAEVSEPLDTYKLSQSPQAKKYDLLAVEPHSDKGLNQVCSGNFECDILTLRLSDHLPVNLYKTNFTRAIQSGTHLEINYSGLLYDTTQRRISLAYGQILTEKTRQKSLLLSNGSMNAFSYRSPTDVSNLALLFGLDENRAKESVFKNGSKILSRAEFRKNKNKQAIVVGGDIAPHEEWIVEKLGVDQTHDLQTNISTANEDTEVEPPAKKRAKKTK